MKILSVIPFKKGILKDDLTYFSSLDIPVGNVVSVPVRSRKVLALVVSSQDLKESKSEVKGMNFNLKKVAQDKGPSIFLKEFLESILEASRYFAQNKNIAFTSLIPSILIDEYDKISKIKCSEVSIKKSLLEKIQNIKTEKLLLQIGFPDRISVYKTLVRESFARGKSVFLVLPTESDIVNFNNYLSKGIEQFTFTLNGGISAKKNLVTYEKIITSPHPVLILATAPFLSIPRKDIGTIILEHESSNAYRMIRRPHFDLRIFAEIYASKINAKLIIADELLRFETIGRKDTDNFYPLHPLSFRIDFTGRIEISGRKEKEIGKKFEILNLQTIEEIRSALRNKKSVFIFSLRKGLATMTICRECGEVLSCEKCGAPMVLYLSNQGKRRMFVCNHCEHSIDGDKMCPACGSWNLIPLGIGTDTVQEYMKEIIYSQADFPKAKIFKLDKESVTTTKEARKIVKEFEETPGSILIGTEMAFFYLTSKVPLSVVASFDSLWNIPNYKMSEKIMHIVLSILGNTEEKLIIQTKNPSDRSLLAIESANLLSFVREELEDRRNLGYPPFKRFIKITFLGDKEQTLKARELLQEGFREHTPEIFSGFVSKVKGKYATNALIKIDPKKWSTPSISFGASIEENLLAKLQQLPFSFEIFVDPEDLL